MSVLGSATVNLKKSHSRKKIMNRFAQTFDGIMKSNFRSYEKYK